MRRLINTNFPQQFWLMFAGYILSATGASMIWPFLTIFVSERLNLPLTAVASLLTINAAAGLVSSLLAGPVIDRLGRKWVMVASLLLNGAGYLYMSAAGTYAEFVLLMLLQGAINPLYRVGADAMIADLVPGEQRVDAYSMMRLSNNVGVAIGPAVGGFIAGASYNLAFYLAAFGFTVYGLLLALRAKETLPAPSEHTPAPEREGLGGYGRIFRDRPFMTFILAFVFAQLCTSVMWVLLPVYAKTNYGLSESLYGFIPTTNAVMVLLLQLPVTARMRHVKPVYLLSAGALLYAIGVGSVALGGGFWGFWVSMVIMTLGELILVPTSSTYAANLAPAHMRGRYMSLYGLTWNVASGIGPLAGGFLNDTFNPHAIWIGAGLAGLLGVLFFARFTRPAHPSSADTARI